ncbi:MAG: ABC transporter substrate-binding protein [Actinobacteria bacterium]|jgi:peptide/nickel transport system substrate-binding protein|nr:ABC transporter substrate-binding protein [Actinomycetota bacterium]
MAPSVNGPDLGANSREEAMARHELSRRAMLRFGLAGVGTLGLSGLLAACGSSGTGGTSTTGGGAGTSGAPAATETGSGATNTAAVTSSSATTGKPGGSINLVRALDAVDFDKTMVFSNASIWVYVNIWETLTIGSADGTKVEPWLAESWEQSDDKLTWTFHLKDGVTFSDGSPMTAADVKFTLDEASKTSGGWEFINAAIDTVTAPDDKTVVVKTKYPWAPLLADLACPSNGIIPNKYQGKTKEDFYKTPFGTGPFVWGNWDKGKSLTLKKNAKYWRKDAAGQQLPYLDSVTWTVVPDDNTRGLQMKGGQAEIDENPPYSSLDQFKGDPAVDVVLFPSTRTDYIMMNEKREYFADVNVRRAVSYAIDREGLNKTLLYGNGTPANSVLMPTVPFYDKNTPGQTYDMAKAKAALAASKFPNGFTCTYSASSGDATDAAVAQVLQASLKELGITMNITNVDPSALHDAQNKLDYDISHSYWTMDIADPDELVQFAVLPEGGGHSFETNYDSPEAQDLAKQAEREFDPAKRQEIYSKLQAVMANDAFLAPLYYQPLPYLVSKKVQGFLVKPTGLYDFGVVSLTA